MAESNTSSSSGGIGFVGLLTIVFIVLKLIGKIDWSWWWVLSPIWISVALVIAILLLIGAVVGGVAVVSGINGSLEDRRRRVRQLDSLNQRMITMAEKREERKIS